MTRKLSYRKDDLAMRPIYGCSENFRESLTMPTATYNLSKHFTMSASCICVSFFLSCDSEVFRY